MIKKALFLVLLLVICQLGISQLSDDFADGDITNNPVWSGDTANYEVNLSLMMHLNAPAQTDTSYLSTPSSSINNATWEFYIQMDFNPSSSNYAKVYLVSDQANFKNPLNGYFVKIGNTSDEISLYRQDGIVETEIIDGGDGRVGTTQVTSAIQVTRDNLGNWQLLSDTTGGSSYFLEGSTSDNTYNSSSFFGVYSRYTPTRSTKFFYDNFNVSGSGFIDTSPPTIDSLTAVSSTDLDIYFNEPLDLTSSQLTSNYTVNNGIGSPNSAILDLIDPSIVHLNFTTPFSNGITNNLTVTNVSDTTNNSIATTVKPFSYLLLVTPNVGDILINEIFADPNPQVGLPIVEFVELYNSSNASYTLNNWKFINSTTSKTLSSFILTPNNYIILCDINDTLLYQSYGNVIGISSFTALTNGGDSLSLLDNNNNIIDIVNYNITWYKDASKDDGGYTLERINPLHLCSSEDNWIASANTQGGTPGTQNSVFDTVPDTQSPNITGISIVSATQFNLLFNEKMDSTSLANAVYSINGGILVSGVIINNNTRGVTITTNLPLDSSTVYTLTIANANDCSGNLLTPNSYSFGIGKAPLQFEILITELLPDPTPSIGLPEQEYIEVYNNSNKIINLTNCWVKDLSSASLINNDAKIFPGEYAIICDDNYLSDFSPYGKVITVGSLPSLNNAEDEYFLYDADTNLIHSVHYFDTWYQDANKTSGGWSLEMIDPNNPCGEKNNWSASTKWFGGTPASQNSINGINTDFSSPEVVNANAINDSTVIVTFNENTMLGSVTINNSIIIGSIAVVNNKSIQLNLSTHLTHQRLYTVTATGAFDCVGNIANTNNTAEFALPEQGLEGDLIINEVLFNPFTGGNDFVEIYNNSSKYIDLSNWKLANLENDSIDNYKTITIEPYLILPNEFVLLTSNATAVKNDYINATENTFLEVESLPTYSNDKGDVYLLNNNDNVIDYFNYNEDMHFSLLNNYKGVSLERIDYNRSTNDHTNWLSASEDEGFATPGYENSQYLTISSEEEITIGPETFSPNNDGDNDVVNISYNFDEPGFVANIIIYDAKGRLIKNLINNKLLGSKGVFSWDGINNNNEKANIGIYIIYIEAFNLDGNVKSFKKTCVLAGFIE